MSGLTEIRRAVAEQLAPLPATVKVALGEADYGNDPAKRLIIGVTIGPPSAETEQLLDEMLEAEGKRSLRATLEADRTLGGVVSELFVVGHSGYRVYPTPDGHLLGAEWRVDYIA